VPEAGPSCYVDDLLLHVARLAREERLEVGVGLTSAFFSSAAETWSCWRPDSTSLLFRQVREDERQRGEHDATREREPEREP